MQPLGEGLGEAIGEHLEHDRVVVVIRAFERGDALLDPSGAHRKGAGPVAHAAFLRRHEIRQAQVRPAGRFLVLLPQVMPGHEALAPRLVAVDLDVVARDLRGGV